MSIMRSVDVAVDPETAFRVFTDEIDEWYESGRWSWNVPERAVGIRFEGGRLLELHDDGDAYEMGRVTVWEPGARLAFAYRNVHLPEELETEVEVRFEPAGDGTRVTLEHHGLEALPAEEYEQWQQRAWIQFMRWFAEYIAARRTV
jgi:hypothetical protein